MKHSKNTSTAWTTRALLVLTAAALVPACGGGSGAPPGAPPLPAGVVQLQAGYVLSVFATSPAGSTKPDSIVQVGNSVYVSYQDGLNSDGTIPPANTVQGNSEVCQYDMSGNLLRTITVLGHNDGMMLFDSNTLWVMSNEDSKPYLNVINLTTGVVTQVYPTGGTPLIFPPTLHHGGYDDMIMIDGVVYVSCSNPDQSTLGQVNANPLVVTLKINAAGTFDVKSVIPGNTPGTDVTTGSAVANYPAGLPLPPPPGSYLNFADPDSMALTPNGDLMVSGQADSALAFIHSPGVAGPQQVVNVLPVTLGGNPWPVDDTRFAPSGTSFMLVTDTGGNTIWRIDPPATGFLTGSTAQVPFTGSAYSAGSGGVYTLNLVTGALSAIYTGLKSPHGIRFITPPASVPSTVTAMDPNYTVSLFAQAPAGSSKPDSIVQVGGPGGNIFVGYQGQLNHDGTVPPLPPGTTGSTLNGIQPVIQYDLKGKVIKTYPVPGHIDGMVEINPPASDGSNLWVMSNEDSSPILTTIVTATGVQAQYLPLVSPPAHGGGYDDMTVIGGKVFVSCSNPTLGTTGNVVEQITTLTPGVPTGTFTVVSACAATATSAYDVLAGSMAGGFFLIDPDATEITPTGDLLVDGQQDATLATLPAASLVAGTPPPGKPTLAAAAGGLSTPGKHSGYVTFVTAAGESFAGAASVQITTTLANATVNWTAIPKSPLGTVTGRNLYMTVAGDTGLPLLVHKILDNTTVAFSASVADASLGAPAPVASLLHVTLFGNPLPADDTRFVPAVAPQFLLVTDSSSNQIYRIDSAAAWAAGKAFDAGAISVNSLDMLTGIATPIVTGMKAPHGLLFVK
jgi:hypothetical protein